MTGHEGDLLKQATQKMMARYEGDMLFSLLELKQHTQKRYWGAQDDAIFSAKALSSKNCSEVSGYLLLQLQLEVQGTSNCYSSDETSYLIGERLSPPCTSISALKFSCACNYYCISSHKKKTPISHHTLALLPFPHLFIPLSLASSRVFLSITS